MRTLLLSLTVLLLALIAYLLYLNHLELRAGAQGKGIPQAYLDSLRHGQYVASPDYDLPLTFAGDTLPTHRPDVRERFEEQLIRNIYFHRSTLGILKRRARYFPTIERILREEGVPQDLKYLAVAESGLQNARSPAGARGVWQFMAPTARAYDLRVTSEVDERYHLEKATRAAARYLKDYHRAYGDWTKAAAAYNIGGPNLDKWLDRQRAASVFELDINPETMAYVFRIVALKTLLENPERYGYYLTENDAYATLDDATTRTVTSSVSNWGDWAEKNGTDYRTLKVYNPWLSSGSLTVRPGERYEVRLPPPHQPR